MNRKLRLFLLLALFIVIGALGLYFIKDHNVAVLNPMGTVAEKQRNILVFTVLLSLIVIIPVFTMLALFSIKYRKGNKKAKYRPDWDDNKTIELIVWGVPIVIIMILSVITWRSSHDLDPYRPLDSDVKPVKIQVVALQWKWLFIYPEHNIASVNFFQFPKNTPVNFEIAADAPMNSFWIPNLGGQVYAMNGMSTKLHLIAKEAGDYPGVSANISGEGFANMRFTARASEQADFDNWVKEIRGSAPSLALVEYEELAKPGSIDEPIFYSLRDPVLYDRIVMKYMMPHDENSDHQSHTTDGSTPEATKHHHEHHDHYHKPEYH